MMVSVGMAELVIAVLAHAAGTGIAPARVAIVVSEPLVLPRSETGLADARAAIEAALAEVNATAAAAVGVRAE